MTKLNIQFFGGRGATSGIRSVGGYTSNMSAGLGNRINSFLTTKQTYSNENGRTFEKTRAQMVSDELKSGSKVSSNGSSYKIGSKQSGYYKISKTEYDYAKYLAKKK